MALFREEKYQEAIGLFDHILSKNANQPDVLNDRGVTWFHLRQLDKALADMNQALDLEPENSYRHSARAYIRDRMGDTAGAIDDYRKATELDPDDAIAWNNLGMAEEKLGHIQKAKERFRRADKLAEEQGMLGNKDNAANHTSEIGTRKVDGGETEPTAPAEVTPLHDRPNPVQNDAKEEAASTGDHMKVMLNVFRRKEAFQDFLRFVKRGFRNEDPS